VIWFLHDGSPFDEIWSSLILPNQAGEPSLKPL